MLFQTQFWHYLMKIKKIHFGVKPAIEASFSPIPVDYIPTSYLQAYIVLTYPYLFSVMSPTRRLGQANYRPKADTSGTSVVRRLASRSLAGQSLGIRIH